MNKNTPTNTARLTQGATWRHLFSLSLPMVIGIISIAVFNLVDTIFVGQLGTTELAALGFTLPVVMVVGGLTMGLGIGVTSIAARRIGTGDMAGVRRVATHGLLLALAVVAALSVAGFMTIEPLFSALGAEGATLEAVKDYMSIWYAGMLFLVVPMVGNSAIRATGDTKTPAWIMIFAGLVNLVLDPLFIFGFGPIPAMGIEGAALATVLGRASTLVLALYFLVIREKLLVFDLRGMASSWSEVLQVGGPAALAQLALPLTMAFVTGLVASHGDDVVAAYAAGGRIQMLAMIPVFALSAGFSPFVGQNWGADRADRVREALTVGSRFAVAWGLGAVAVLTTLSGVFAGLFTDDAAVAAHLTTYLRIMPLAFVPYGLYMLSVSTMNAMGRSVPAMALGLLRAPGLALLFAWLGGATFGIEGIFLGLASASAVAGLLSWPLVRHFTAESTRQTSLPHVARI